MSRRGEVEVRFGYTIRDIDRIAQHAANRAFGGALYPPDRLDTAWHGVVEHLYSCAGPPTPLDLHRAGVHAVQQDNQAEFHHHGIHQRDRLGGAHQAPRYAAYWLGQHSTPSPENQIVDRLALMEIWFRLFCLH